MVREMEGSDREVRGETVSSEDEIQLVAGFVSGRRRRKVEVKGGEEREKRFQFTILNVEVTEEDECGSIVRDV